MGAYSEVIQSALFKSERKRGKKVTIKHLRNQVKSEEKWSEKRDSAKVVNRPTSMYR